MAARKFGPEERDLDDSDSMAQIQELQEQLNRLHRQSSIADGNGAAAGRFASADIIAQFASHDGVRPTRYEPPKCRPDHSALRVRLAWILLLCAALVHGGEMHFWASPSW
jgi:hypothetical protein